MRAREVVRRFIMATDGVALRALHLAAVLAVGLAAGDAIYAQESDATPSLAPHGIGTPAELLRTSWPLLPARTYSAAPTPEQSTDSWGVRKNFGLAAAEVLIVNRIVWAYNEYIRGADFTQVNPRSWWHNIERGFTWDDNHFNTNQFAHPFHGNLYFNAARTNGYNYWESAPFSIAGSLLWECCGETHQGAINDWIATGVGGIALGEMTYRVSSMILDNTATGSGRIWKEIGATAVNPVRGFNRLISGRWTRVDENPPDRIPSIFANKLLAGVRVIGEGESISDSTRTNAFFEVNFRFGSPFTGEREDPFDFFGFDLQLNTAEKQLIGRLQVRGSLYSADMKRSEKVGHVFVVAQNFDYFDNFAFEFGGQSVSASIFSQWVLSDTWRLMTFLDGYGILMGALSADFADRAQFPPDFKQENLRTYDFGPGVGAGLGAIFYHKGRDLLTLRFRTNFIVTLNGSVEEGDDAHHIFHWTFARVRVPIRRNFGLGADFAAYIRDSFYTCEGCFDTSTRNPEVRVYGIWDVGRIGW